MKIENIVISTTDGADDNLGRTATISLNNSVGVVHLGADYADGGGVIDTTGDATVYPNTAKAIINPPTPKHAFLVDPDIPDRFVHVSSAKSTMTHRYVDFFFDTHTNLLFVIDDLNIFDKDGVVDAGTHTHITGTTIMIAANFGDSYDNVSGNVPHAVEDGIAISAPVGSTTQLLYMSGVSNMMTIYNTGMIIDEEFYLEGNASSCAQFVSLGKSSDIFNSPIPFFRLTYSSVFAKNTFQYTGMQDVKDICIPLIF